MRKLKPPKLISISPLSTPPMFFYGKSDVDRFVKHANKIKQQHDELRDAVERLIPHLSGCWQQEMKSIITKVGDKS